MSGLSVTRLDVMIDRTAIVRACGLEVPAGQMVGLVGPNGSGKSTLLRSVYRALKPAAGRVVVDGEDVWRLGARQAAQRTAAVAQESPADFDYSVRDDGPRAASAAARGRQP